MQMDENKSYTINPDELMAGVFKPDSCHRTWVHTPSIRMWKVHISSIPCPPPHLRRGPGICAHDLIFDHRVMWCRT